MDHPHRIEPFLRENVHIITNVEIREFLHRLSKEYLDNPDGFEVARTLAAYQESEASEHLLFLQMKERTYQNEHIERVFEDLKLNLAFRWLDNEIRKVYQALRQPGAEKDTVRIDQLLNRRRELTQLMAELKKEASC